MKGLLAQLILTILLFQWAESALVCPSLSRSSPECVCSDRVDGSVIVVCQGIHNTSHLEEITKPLKSLVVDRLLLVDVFPNYNATLDELESAAIEPKPRTPSVPLNGALPKKWLSELRVRDLEILQGKFNGYLLTDDAFEGQADFLTSLIVKHANLKGHLCSSCGPTYSHVSTKGLRRTPLLETVDFSHNQLEVLDGVAFPERLKKLSRVVLANNKITRVHDNAFVGLSQLRYVDLSGNRLTAVSRRIFRMPVDLTLEGFDLSNNAIQKLPEDLFHKLNVLKEVKMNNNLLETFPVDTWGHVPDSMQTIEVRGNFIVCNCTMAWMNRHLNKTVRLSGNCVAPKVVELKPLRAVSASLTACTRV